jgi:hypothetical protein
MAELLTLTEFRRARDIIALQHYETRLKEIEIRLAEFRKAFTALRDEREAALKGDSTSRLNHAEEAWTAFWRDDLVPLLNEKAAILADRPRREFLVFLSWFDAVTENVDSEKELVLV